MVRGDRVVVGAKAHIQSELVSLLQRLRKRAVELRDAAGQAAALRLAVVEIGGQRCRGLRLTVIAVTEQSPGCRAQHGTDRSARRRTDRQAGHGTDVRLLRALTALVPAGVRRPYRHATRQCHAEHAGPEPRIQCSHVASSRVSAEPVVPGTVTSSAREAAAVVMQKRHCGDDLWRNMAA
jgi:hypothetical protein